MSKTILIVLIVAIVAGGAATFGGYKMGDNAGFERANQVRQQFSQQRQAAGGQGQQAGFGSTGGGQSRSIQGTIKSVNGDTVTVTLGQRDVQVNLSTKTQVQKAGSGNRDDLKAGVRVMVTPDGSGGSNSDSVNAATIMVLQSE